MRSFIPIAALLATLANAASTFPDTSSLSDSAGPAQLNEATLPVDNADADDFDDHTEAAHMGGPESDKAGSVAIHHSLSLGTLLGTFKNRGVYFVTAVASQVTIKEVIAKLQAHKHHKLPSTSPHRRGFIMETLQWGLLLLLTLIVIFKQAAPGDGMQIVNIGLDDGKGLTRRETFPQMQHPYDAVTWDVSSDEAHAIGNMYQDRPIMSDELRHQIISEGHSNVTFLHHDSPDGKTPVLVYHSDNKLSHFHWRQPDSHLVTHRNKDKTFERHYPFFDAGGAGFKISAISPLSETPTMSEADAKPIAHAISEDFLSKRAESTYVGYAEQVKGSSLMGHKFCLIAEATKFGLHNEIDKCFPKEGAEKKAE